MVVDFSLLINLIEDGVEFRMVSARPEVRILSPRLFPVSKIQPVSDSLRNGLSYGTET
jgi:hypothetical protein